MSPVPIAIAALFCLLVMSALGIPVGIALAMVGLTGLWLVASPEMALVSLKTLPYALGTSYTFVVVPMFILTGLVISSAGLVTDLYDTVNRWFARVRGSLLMVTTVASAGFGAISGSTVVNASVFTKIALPEMIRLGYKPGASAAAIAASGTLAAMIPPSILFVIYAIITQQSIGQLLIAGLLPGILTMIIYLVGIGICVRVFKDWTPAPCEHYNWRQKLEGLQKLWPLALLFLIVVGGIYTGWASPSAASGLGAVCAILIVLTQRRIGLSTLWTCLKETVEISASLFLIVVGGMLFSRFLTVAGFIPEMVELVQQSNLNQVSFFLAVIILFLFLGMFIDTISILLIVVPTLDPIVVSLGIHPILYAVIVIKLLEIAAVSPPFGLNLFAVIAAANDRVSSWELYRCVIPFIILDLIVILILLAFPFIATWLPAQMI